MARVTIVPSNITGLSSGFLAGSAVAATPPAPAPVSCSWSTSALGRVDNNGLSFLVVSNGATATAANILAPGVRRFGSSLQLGWSPRPRSTVS